MLHLSSSTLAASNDRFMPHSLSQCHVGGDAQSCGVIAATLDVDGGGGYLSLHHGSAADSSRDTIPLSCSTCGMIILLLKPLDYSTSSRAAVCRRPGCWVEERPNPKSDPKVRSISSAGCDPARRTTDSRRSHLSK
jgi:hypothetical protein